jgi:hypothetical protein
LVSGWLQPIDLEIEMNTLLKIIIISFFVFSVPGLASAREMDKLKVGTRDAAKLDYVEVHDEDLIEVKKKVWEQASTRSIPVEGSLFPSSGVGKVQYSLNGGMAYFKAQEVDPFYFTFVPFEGTTYPIVIRFFDRFEEVVFIKKIDVKFTAIDWNIFFRDLIEEIRRAYVDGDINTFMSYIDEDEYPFREQFKRDIEKTFAENGFVNLSITVNKVELSSDKCSVDIDWGKTFEDDSVQSGGGTAINFIKRRNGWKIVAISDEEAFVVGSGAVYFFY